MHVRKLAKSQGKVHELLACVKTQEERVRWWKSRKTDTTQA